MFVALRPNESGEIRGALDIGDIAGLRAIGAVYQSLPSVPCSPSRVVFARWAERDGLRYAAPSMPASGPHRKRRDTGRVEARDGNALRAVLRHGQPGFLPSCLGVFRLACEERAASRNTGRLACAGWRNLPI